MRKHIKHIKIIVYNSAYFCLWNSVGLPCMHSIQNSVCTFLSHAILFSTFNTNTASIHEPVAWAIGEIINEMNENE